MLPSRVPVDSRPKPLPFVVEIAAGGEVEPPQRALDVLLQLGLGHAGLLEVLQVEVGDAELLQRRQEVDIARRRVGHAHAAHRGEEIGPPQRSMPGDRRAPVVTDDHGLGLAERLDQLDHVADQVEQRVGVDRLGRLGAAVAAHVGRDAAEAGGADRLELMPPRVPALRPAMAEQHQRAAAGLGVAHVDAVGLGGLERRAHALFLQRHFIVAAAASTIAGRAMNEVGAREAMPVRPLPTVQPSASTPPTPISAAPAA